ncbi:hypothetical protein [Nostoc sp.]|uniref:hypothetical protein n=1 Tax=Nostoc sp. TaxID=1180 RepID=UPI002FFA5815
MSIENLFGGLTADNSSKLNGIGSDPTAVGKMGNSLGRIKEKMKLPEKINAQTVIKLEKELGKVDGEIELGRQIVQKQGQQLDKLTQLHQINSQWAETTMKVDQKVREIESTHKQKVSQYMLGASETQAYLDGYQEAYQMSAEIFS